MNTKDLIEVKLLANPNVIRETLTRIGIANKKLSVLYPTCYLYTNFDKCYIVHFKELFLLTRQNGYNNMSPDDFERKNSIIYCLIQWGLVQLVSNEDDIEPHDKFIFVLPYSMKKSWNIQHKFNISNIVTPE